MPLGAARIALLAKTQVVAAAEVIRKKSSITTTNNPQISTTQNQFGGSSALFDGIEDRLNIEPLLNFDGTSEFTIEGWFYVTSGDAQRNIISNHWAYGTSSGWVVSLDNGSGGGQLEFWWYDGATEKKITGTTNYTDSTWHHFAVSFDGTTCRLYLDGTEGGSLAMSNINTGTGGTCMGANANNINGGNFGGHIDEIRVSNTARYTTSFTPSTTPFVNDENTLLLLHMDGTNGSTVFEDDNGVRFKNGVRALGNAQIDTAQSYFGGASAVFDGSLDQLRITNDDFAFGTGDFTIEGWTRWTTLGNDGIFHLDTSFYPGSETGLAVAGRPSDWTYYAGTKTTVTSTSPSTNTWYHWALVRSSGTTSLYVDGTSIDSKSDTNNYTGTDLMIGGYYGGSFLMIGNIDEFRVSNTARYTSGFTPSTTPFVNDDNTLLLLHMDGTDGSTYFEDDNGVRSKVGVGAFGDAQIDTAQSQFGGASALFDGTGDYLDTNDVLIPATGDFTLEAWVRLDTTGANRNIIEQYNGASSGRLAFARQGSLNVFQFFIGDYSGSSDVLLRSTTNPSTNTWYHVAVVRSGNDFELFVDGTSEDTQTASGVTIYTGDNTRIGKLAATDYFDGYIDELRISNTARYTANFTPATETFQNDDNTLLLLHMDGTDGSTDFIDDNGVDTLYWG